VNTYTTASIGGTTYFVIPNSVSSGAVQILGNPGTNNPVLSGGTVAPGAGSQYTSFSYSVTVTDADNDSMSSAYVYIDGSPKGMSESDPSDADTTDGKAYYYVTTLSATSHTYYFVATDNTSRSGNTSSVSGPTVGQSSRPLTVSTSPGIEFLGVMALFGLAFLLFLRKP
jgi:endoglucanase